MVPQDDVLFPHLTVRENVMHAARVRLPRTWETARVAAFVDLRLADLGLTAVLHSVVDDGVIGSRGISGGERKRTSIAVGMAAAPFLLLVDEPTSGLDATSALQVCRLLKRLAEGGLTVVVVLHQPRTEIWEAVDRVVLLQRGSVVFEGTQEDATALALATAATAEGNSRGEVYNCHSNGTDDGNDVASGPLLTEGVRSRNPHNRPHRNPADVVIDLVASGSFPTRVGGSGSGGGGGGHLDATSRAGDVSSAALSPTAIVSASRRRTSRAGDVSFAALSITAVGSTSRRASRFASRRASAIAVGRRTSSQSSSGVQQLWWCMRRSLTQQ